MFPEELTMIAVFVTFEYAEGFDRKRILAIAENVKGTFAGIPGLRQKAFTLDDESRRARNVCLWESEEAAQAFFTPSLTQRITSLYGVAPRIEFAEVPALVDNAAGRVARGSVAGPASHDGWTATRLGQRSNPSRGRREPFFLAGVIRWGCLPSPTASV
ncbi:MAG TPA: hypothetical protein VLT82_15780 [Myxococcaceae bacterium]|nr:hypothetical protein [Myxococcaceae bacterium]